MFTKHSVEKSSKTRSPFLRENCHFFRQINVFTKEVTKEMISRKFLSVIAFYSTFIHCEKNTETSTQCGSLRIFLPFRISSVWKIVTLHKIHIFLLFCFSTEIPEDEDYQTCFRNFSYTDPNF